MGASCGGGSNTQLNDEDYYKIGLRPRHGYALLDVFNKRDLRLLYLRNPWGHYSWKGNWSYKSELWNSKLKKRLMPQGLVEGNFWISYEDVLKYFDSVDICKIRPNWNEARMQGM